VREDRADHERVMRFKAPLERLFERGDLRAQLALREVGEYLGIGRPGDERVEHRATGLAEDVRRDAVQLDAAYSFMSSQSRSASPRLTSLYRGTT